MTHYFIRAITQYGPFNFTVRARGVLDLLRAVKKVCRGRRIGLLEWEAEALAPASQQGRRS